LRLWQQLVWRWLSSGLMCRVDWYEFTDIGLSEVLIDSMIRALNLHVPDGGGSKHLWNVNKFLLDGTAQHSKRRTLYDTNFSEKYTFCILRAEGNSYSKQMFFQNRVKQHS
jgi:hypothetical protein